MSAPVATARCDKTDLYVSDCYHCRPPAPAPSAAGTVPAPRQAKPNTVRQAPPRRHYQTPETISLVVHTIRVSRPE